MAKYIYFVGKPYPFQHGLEIIRQKGYKIGLFKDKSLSGRPSENYDSLVEVDFSSQQTILNSLKGLNLTVDGLVCTYENYIVAKAQLAAHFQVPAISEASANMSTDKYLMRQAFQRADPAITPGFGLVASEAEALALAKNLGYPLILKPTNLVKSLLVMRCNNQAELLRNFGYAQARLAELYIKQRVYGRQPRLLLEQYVEGRICSVAAFIDKAGEVHCCEGIAALINAQDIGIDDNYIYRRSLPGDFDKELEKKLFATAKKGAVALALTSTPAHIELIYDQHSVKLIEIGARIGGYRPRMYSLSYGLDLIAEEIELALGQTPNLSGNFKGYSAVYELFPHSEGVFKGIEGAVNDDSFYYYSVKAQLGDRIGPAKNGHKAAAVIIINSADKTDFAKLDEQVNSLRVKIR